MKYSNPRKQATFTDWPLGGNRRGQCVFSVESNKKGERISRVTTGAPKYSVYAEKSVIVDGDDGRTYLMQKTPYAIHVYRSDFMSQEYIPLDKAREYITFFI